MQTFSKEIDLTCGMRFWKNRWSSFKLLGGTVRWYRPTTPVITIRVMVEAYCIFVIQAKFITGNSLLQFCK